MMASKVHLGNPKTGHPTCGQKASYSTHNMSHVTCQRCGRMYQAWLAGKARRE